MINTLLLQAGIIAIPLKARAELGLKPMPNFIVFESQGSKLVTPQFNFQTGELEETDCVQTSYKIVNRQILLPNDVYPTETYMERSLLPLENLPVPVDILPLFFSYSRIKANIQTINAIFGFFFFRGDLEGFVLEVDEDALDDILAPEVITTTIQEITTENITTTQLITTTEQL